MARREGRTTEATMTSKSSGMRAARYGTASVMDGVVNDGFKDSGVLWSGQR